MEKLKINADKPVILISDNEPETIELLYNIYKKDYNVVTAQSGKETIEIFQKMPIDLIMLDVNMPDINGFNICQKLRNGCSLNYVHRPYIFMITDPYDEQSIDKAFDSGADDCIRKPLNPNILHKRIKTILDAKQSNDTLMYRESKLKIIFENAMDGILVADAKNYKFLDANHAICKMSGYDKQELLKLGIRDILPKGEASSIFPLIERHKKGGIGLIEAVPVKKKDGTIFYADINSTSIALDNRQCLVGFFRDMTKRLSILNELEAHKHSLEDLVSERTAELNLSLMKLRVIMDSIIKAIALTVEVKDPYTAGHQRQVSKIARKIASKMGLAKDQVEGIRVASVLHDIGKIQVPSEILTKPYRLNEFEFGLIKLHSETGWSILKGINFPWPIAEIVRQHHEKINGLGYPFGLKGDEILIEARIICIADVFDAITSHRPYRPALGTDFALIELVKNKGILYDSLVVEAFEECIMDKDFTNSTNSMDL